MKNREYFKFDPKNKKHVEQKETYLVKVDGRVLKNVPLKKSRPVGKIEESRKDAIRKSRGLSKYLDQPTYLEDTARINRETGGVLDKGIQLHRHWFQYLKLALELESLGKKVELVTVQSQINKIKNTDSDDIPAHLKGVGVLSRARVIERVKVKREKYEGWDLDQVLNDTFNKWWETHSHLFEGHSPSFLDSKNEWVDDPKFLYLRIDASSKRKDVHQFLREELGKRLSDKGKPSFLIEKKKNPRPDQLHNRYNALVLTLNPIVDGVKLEPRRDKKICEHKNIYLRAPDERSGKDGRLTVPVWKVKKNGKYTGKVKIQYGNLVGNQRKDGIHHLMNAIGGRFGSAPPNK